MACLRGPGTRCRSPPLAGGGAGGLFGDGHFVASPSFAAENALAEPVDGGYRVTGTWHFCSGVPYATPTSASPRYPTTAACRGRGPAQGLHGPGRLGRPVGLKGSGSHSVHAEDALVPASHHHVRGVRRLRRHHDSGLECTATPCTAAFVPFAIGELNPSRSATRTGVDEFERMITARPTLTPSVDDATPAPRLRGSPALASGCGSPTRAQRLQRRALQQAAAWSAARQTVQGLRPGRRGARASAISGQLHNSARAAAGRRAAPSPAPASTSRRPRRCAHAAPLTRASARRARTGSTSST